MPRPKTFPAEICPPAAPAAVGRLRASPTSATDSLAARECLVRLTVRTDTPHTRLLRSFPFRPAPGFGYESAAPAVMGSLLTAYAGPHPARCTGIGYRRSSSTRILAFRKHDAHPVDAPQRLWLAPAHSMPTLVLSSIVTHCEARCSRDARGYRRCSPWPHSCRTSPSCAPVYHRPMTAPCHTIQPRSGFKARLCQKNFSRKRQKFQKKR